MNYTTPLKKRKACHLRMTSTWLSTKKLITPDYVCSDTIQPLFVTSSRIFDTKRNNRVCVLKNNIPCIKVS